MKTCNIPHTELAVSRMGYGCAGLVAWDKSPVRHDDISKAMRVINTAYDSGITLFDHADIYAFGKSEATFGEVLKRSPGLRRKIVLQTKCGQCLPDAWKPGEPIGVDLSRQHIMAAVEGSLQRLQTDYLDILLLHLPDALMEPDEIAKAFDDLNSAGKARYFGVSNYSGDQIDLLATYIGRPIVVNQIHVSLGRTSPVADGQEFTLNISKDTTRDHDYSGVAGPGTLDYCRKHGIQVQAWSPLRGDLLDPQPHAAPEVKRTASALKELAQQKDVTPSAIALAWLMRHPVGIVPLIGATTASHIVDNCAADGVTLSSQEWYRLFAAAAPLESRFI